MNSAMIKDLSTNAWTSEHMIEAVPYHIIQSVLRASQLIAAVP